MILSKRITAKSRDAKPEIQASRRTVKVMRELRPAAFVSVEDFICLAVGFLSGNMTLAFAVLDADDDDEACDDDDDLFDSMFCQLADVECVLCVYAACTRVYYQCSQSGARHMCTNIRTTRCK